jgi:hypothetical protein
MGDVIRANADTYKKELVNVNPNEKYESSTEYFYEVTKDYCIDIIGKDDETKTITTLIKLIDIDDSFDFSDGRTYKKYSFNKAESGGDFVYGYKPV